MPGEGDNRTLISAQYGDTMFMLKHAKNSTDEKTTFYDTETSKRNGSAIGNAEKITDSEAKRNDKIKRDNISSLPVKAGDVVYIFSDGIGEFLSTEEIQDVLSSNVYPHLLLTEVKEKIIEKGIVFKHHYKEIDEITDITLQKQVISQENDRETANKLGFKHHDLDHPRHAQEDDLSIAFIKVT